LGLDQSGASSKFPLLLAIYFSERFTLLPKFLSLACVLSFVMGASAQTQPQVAFIGDNLTYLWQQQPQFQAHKNWLPYGVNVPLRPGGIEGAGTSAALSQLQKVIATGQKPIIHLLVGQADEDNIDSGGDQAAFLFAAFATNMEKIITTAQAAKLKIVVGTIPYSAQGNLNTLNHWIFLYCNAHNIPVINYAFALNTGVGSGASGPQNQAPVYYNPFPTGNQISLYEPSLTSAGYDLITDMAQTEIGLTADTFKLVVGYLNDETMEDLEDPPTAVNNNSVVDGSTIQFTAYGEFSDGSTRIINNADQYGHVGTWTSSSPNVVLMDQYGVGTSYSKGSSNIHFVSNSGIAFYEWTMYVGIDDPSGGTYSNY
jgi:Bacterial Ig-like domain (group 2)